jgi:UDP-N-acetylglucosamine--N-acetylmuramyl-(pentapeptide) pyrophosphoryl-undecaprenol N-acetylglucosamine transferase
MSRQKPKRIIISGGGTGGHIFPAISIANALRRIDPGIEILFVGAEGRMEMEKVPAAGYRIIGLPVSGLYRSLTFKNVKVLYRLVMSIFMAKKIIREFCPDVAVGVGSYAGVTNRLLAKKASAICVAYEGMEKYFPSGKIIKTGNPVRHNFDNLDNLREEALSFFKLKKDLPVVLVLGGSLGAGTINKSLEQDLEKIMKSGCQWLWQTGKNYFENINSLITPAMSGMISVHGFINRMENAFAAADIIISRAGAGTISELCLVGKPVILVPSPNVAEDHQTKNALALTYKNAAIMIRDSEASKRLVDEAIKLVSNKKERKSLSKNISMMAARDADVKIAQEVLKLAGK